MKSGGLIIAKEGNVKDITDNHCVAYMNHIEYNQFLKHLSRMCRFPRWRSIFFG